MKQTIAVNDANILIDFCDIGLMDALAQLDLALWTSDLVISEIQIPEQRSQVLQFIVTGHLLAAEFSAKEIGQIALQQAKIPALSFADCSVLFLAGQQKGVLLTGDRLLRLEAEKEGIEVHGSLWVLDRMVQRKAIDTVAACQALLELMRRNPCFTKWTYSNKMPLKRKGIEAGRCAAVNLQLVGVGSGCVQSQIEQRYFFLANNSSIGGSSSRMGGAISSKVSSAPL